MLERKTDRMAQVSLHRSIQVTLVALAVAGLGVRESFAKG